MVDFDLLNRVASRLFESFCDHHGTPTGDYYKAGLDLIEHLILDN